MSARLDVLAAVKALIAAACPQATVRGLDADAAKPERIPAGGMVVVREGDPGPATLDLSPLTYNYDHAIPLELSASGDATHSPPQAIDAMLVAIGTALAADRTLGGLVFWLDADAPQVSDITADGAPVAAGADLVLTASYATSNPLT